LSEKTQNKKVFRI